MANRIIKVSHTVSESEILTTSILKSLLAVVVIWGVGRFLISALSMGATDPYPHPPIVPDRIIGKMFIGILGVALAGGLWVFVGSWAKDYRRTLADRQLTGPSTLGRVFRFIAAVVLVVSLAITISYTYKARMISQRFFEVQNQVLMTRLGLGILSNIIYEVYESKEMPHTLEQVAADIKQSKLFLDELSSDSGQYLRSIWDGKSFIDPWGNQLKWAKDELFYSFGPNGVDEKGEGDDISGYLWVDFTDHSPKHHFFLNNTL